MKRDSEAVFSVRDYRRKRRAFRWPPRNKMPCQSSAPHAARAPAKLAHPAEPPTSTSPAPAAWREAENEPGGSGAIRQACRVAPRPKNCGVEISLGIRGTVRQGDIKVPAAIKYFIGVHRSRRREHIEPLRIIGRGQICVGERTRRDGAAVQQRPGVGRGCKSDVRARPKAVGRARRAGDGQ